MNEQISVCERFTNDRVESIRSELDRTLSSDQYAVVTGGSYARGEASSESDLDYFLVCDSDAACEQAKSDLQAIRTALKKHVTKDPAAGGAFGEIESIDKMGRNIGGTADDNGKITRRILFLLEGQWLYNQRRFESYRDELIGKYITEKISDHQFCRFLLNDLIRYYRTVCVDFEHKTKEEGKAWGTRNIKLIFSRKLLYFSGVVVAAETWQHTYATKLSRAKNLLGMTPIRRIEYACGDAARPVLNAYGEFLRKMADPAIRKMLEDVSDVREQQPAEFRLFKNEGHHFSWMLAKLLRDTYDMSHPIHNALVV